MFRIGQGYDVHKLVSNRKLVLGGVVIPSALGLLGHSDADVLTHAIMDSLLGAAVLGDIGKHFPDKDPLYRNADSMKLLREVCRKIRSEGYEICNIDSTVCAESPKLSPHIFAMRAAIASACSLDISQVSVKATTEEGLGFTGKQQGMSATAICLLTTQK